MNDGGSAFPQYSDHAVWGGLTMLDYFAAKAMQAMLTGRNDIPRDLAGAAYEVAMAMIAERERLENLPW